MEITSLRTTFTLLVLLFFLSFFAVSQSNEPPEIDNEERTEKIIVNKPELGQGYLILDRRGEENIFQWKLTVLKKTIDTAGVISSNIETTELLDPEINFYYMPLEFRKGNTSKRYYTIIEGISSDGSTVFTSDSTLISSGGEILIKPMCHNCTPKYTQGCSWVCNGPTYAWAIIQSVNIHSPNGSTHYQLWGASDYYDTINSIAIPYYQYMSKTAYDNACDLHYLEPKHCAAPIIGATVFTTGVINTNLGNKTYWDSQGNPLSGLIVGISKDLERWDSTGAIAGPDIIETDYSLMGGLSNCSNSRVWAINNMNNYADFTRGFSPDYPALECIAAPGSIGGGTGSSFGSGACLPPNITNSQGHPFMIGTDGDFYDFMDKIVDCLCANNSGYGAGCYEPEEPDPDGLPWPTAVTQVFISDMNNPTNPPITITTEELIDEEGNFIGLEIPMDRGLYNIGVMAPNGSYIPYITEVSSNTPNHYNESNLADINVYPKPLDNFISVSISSSINTVLDHELVGMDGQPHNEVTWNLQQGNNMFNIEIDLEVLTTGIYFHRFIFEDGSVTTIETYKN